MANKEYYDQWLKLKQEMISAVEEDKRIQGFAEAFTGIKPQSTAVEIVAKVYCKYCSIYNKLCDCYDQMEQAQRRPFIKRIIDAIACRLLELKATLEEVEVFEFTYPENALQQMFMIPHEVEILCPFFYPFEIRSQEMQYIVDEILAGNRLGDPTPTPSELFRKEEEREEQERIEREEKEAEIKRKLAMGEEILESVQSEVLSPQEIEERRLREEFEKHIFNIQRMERSRKISKENCHKKNKDAALYLELSGTKKPPAPMEIRLKAVKLIQMVYRMFMQCKRDQNRERNLKCKLGMYMSSYQPPSAKIQLEKVKALRRTFRQKYHEKWLAANTKENARVLRLRKGDVMEDISTEIRAWFQLWYDNYRVFDEFPYPDEGGSILVVRGETFTLAEYFDWRTIEEKRLKVEAGNPKSKEQIKAEKLEAKLEKKRLALDAKIREEKRLIDYKKQRMNPDNDPGIYLKVGEQLAPVADAWHAYESQFKAFDTVDASLDVKRGHIMEIITENAYEGLQIKLRPIVDEMMRLELKMLQAALKEDLAQANAQMPLVKKRRKPKKVKPPKPDKSKPAQLFQELVDNGIIRKYPKVTLEDYWGDRNYAAAERRAVLWTPTFPSPCIGDVMEQVRLRCLLTLGCECPNAVRTQLLVGPKYSGKKALIYAIATETNSILIDLSPMNVYDKYPGPKNLKRMFQLIVKISKFMQPTVIFVNNADKLFYKKVPKEEKDFDPTRLQRDFFKEVVKPIKENDKIMVLGTATEPWLTKYGVMYKVFPSLIMIPRTDFGSIAFILRKLLMKYHAVDRNFDIQCIAQTLRGYDIHSIKRGVEVALSGKRLNELYYRPLTPTELVQEILRFSDGVYTDDVDYSMYSDFYNAYSPWGKKYAEYMLMIETQLKYKLKKEKKKA